MIRDENPLFNRWLALIILLGFALRLFSALNTHILNPDGCNYIHQARALYYGQWNEILSCSYSFLSIYPVLIAGLYKIIGDWVTAALVINLFFGTFTIIPLYLLIREFFDSRISALITFIYGVNPTLVWMSVAAVRGPVYWFFLLLGICFFVKAVNHGKSLALFLSGFCFVVASWSRIEACLPIVASCIYIVFFHRNNRFRFLAAFLLPVFITGLISIGGLMVLDKSIMDIFRTEAVFSRFWSLFRNYQGLHSTLSQLEWHSPAGLFPLFLDKAKNMIWLVALGSVINTAVELFFFYPLVFLFMGLRGISERIQADRRVILFLFLAPASFILVYLVILQSWFLEKRYLIGFFFSSFIFIGFGLERIIDILKSRFKLHKSMINMIALVFVIGFCLPENLLPRERDKLLFKKMGEMIAEREDHSQVIRLFSSCDSPHLRWILFYANLSFPGAPCPRLDFDVYRIFGNDFGQFIDNMDRENIKYFLWTERCHVIAGPKLTDIESSRRFVEMKRGIHPDTGEIILFRME